jgi:hypothetical protein
MMFALSCSNKAQTEKPIKPKGPHLAKINGVEITAQDVREEFNLLPQEIQQLYATEDGMESLLDELVKKELLYQEGKKRGYQKDHEFKKQVEEFKRRLTIALLLSDEIEKKAVVSDKEIKDFYETNKEKFVKELPGGEESEIIELEMVEDLIRERLVAEQQKEIFNSYVESLKKTARVELNMDALKSAFGNSVAP